MVVCGQDFTPELLDRITDWVTEEPQLSRRALSRRVCEWLNWRAHDGRLKQMSCRVALCKLARAGALQLPQARAASSRARAAACEQVLPRSERAGEDQSGPPGADRSGGFG